MEVNYQKLYAYLAGQIDDTLQIIADELCKEEHTYDSIITIGDNLKDALLTAEEWYIDSVEDP